MTPKSDLLTLAQEVAEVSRLVDGDDLEATLKRYVDRLIASVPGCDHASITVAVDGGLETVAGTGEPDLVDVPNVSAPWSGPIHESLAFGEPRRLADVEHDDRWPDFTVRMLKTGFRCALVLPLGSESEPAAVLTLFSRQPDQFGRTTYDVTLLFVLHAGVVFDNATLYHDSQTLVKHLRTALATRSTVGQAQGLLMHRHGYDTSAAFSALRGASQHANVKLRDVAAALVRAHTENGLEQALDEYGLS